MNDNYSAALAAVEVDETPIPTFVDVEPWEVSEPSTADVLRAATDLQLSIEDAKTHLIDKLRADAKRLALASASTVDEINAANAEADAARERADELAAARQAALDSAESHIYNFGTLKLQIREVRALALSDADEKAIAESALNFFILKNADPSARNVSGFVTTATDLTLRLALTPHVAAFCAPLEAKCAALAKSVRELAATNKIDLAVFIKTLLSEKHRHQSGKLSDATLYKGLIE
jgi:hypothetical protein